MLTRVCMHGRVHITVQSSVSSRRLRGRGCVTQKPVYTRDGVRARIRCVYAPSARVYAPAAYTHLDPCSLYCGAHRELVSLFYSTRSLGDLMGRELRGPESSGPVTVYGKHIESGYNFIRSTTGHRNGPWASSRTSSSNSDYPRRGHGRGRER